MLSGGSLFCNDPCSSTDMGASVEATSSVIMTIPEPG